MMKTIHPTAEQIEKFSRGDQDRKFCMINLLKFKDKAEYTDDRPESKLGLTGAQAYTNYGAAIQPILKKIGAQIILNAVAEQFFIGTGDWDAVAIVLYPTRRSFLEMAQSKEYQAIHYHRDAGLSHQDLIATSALIANAI